MAALAETVVVLLPVYNDWRALSLLLPRLIESLTACPQPFGILIIDDGSTDPMPDALGRDAGLGVGWLKVLRLRRNTGHQRAIAVGLCHIHEHLPCSLVVVMDADGEDRPEDVPRLLARARDDRRAIVFAERRRRAEGLMFRLFYRLYRLLHVALTGSTVRVGNFSAIPRERLSSLVVVSELWIHYAASVFRSRQPLSLLPTTRGARLDGRSKMNFVALVVHGLSAISVYSDVVFTRLVVASAALVGASLALLVAAIGVRVFTDLAVPGWATYVAGFLLLMLIQAVTFVAGLTFQVLGARHQMTSLPQRDYGYFVQSVLDLPLARP